MKTMTMLRYAAFTDTPAGGNPAGVVLDSHGLDAEQMQSIAAVVAVITRIDGARASATLTSVVPHLEPVPAAWLDGVLAALRWSAAELDPALPPRIGYAGARHLILAARTRQRLAVLDYDFEMLKRLMLDADLTTVDLVWRESTTVFHARNPFPVGAAAAAFGAYLRELCLVPPTATVTVHQGEDMGRPSLLRIDIDAARPQIRVSGQAVALHDVPAYAQ